MMVTHAATAAHAEQLAKAALLAVVTLGLCPLAAWLGEKAATRAN